MATIRCSVFDEALDAHGAVAMDVATKIRHLRDRALRGKDEHLVNVCDKALLGDELVIVECVDKIAQADEEVAR